MAGLEPGNPLSAFEGLAPEMAVWKASGEGKPKKETIFLDPLINEYRTYSESRTCPLKPKNIYETMAERYGWKEQVSYSTFKRWTHRNKLSERWRSHETCRIEGKPGEEVQIDSLIQLSSVMDGTRGNTSTSRTEIQNIVLIYNSRILPDKFPLILPRPCAMSIMRFANSKSISFSMKKKST